MAKGIVYQEGSAFVRITDCEASGCLMPVFSEGSDEVILYETDSPDTTIVTDRISLLRLHQVGARNELTDPTGEDNLVAAPLGNGYISLFDRRNPDGEHGTFLVTTQKNIENFRQDPQAVGALALAAAGSPA